jgi:hypothetical protein
VRNIQNSPNKNPIGRMMAAYANSPPTGLPGWVRGKQDTGEIGSSEVIEGILISGLYHISLTEPLTLQFLQQFDWGE